jgi:hypothetical protein
MLPPVPKILRSLPSLYATIVEKATMPEKDNLLRRR